MRILKIVNSVDSGGVFNCEKQFLKELKKQDIEIDLIVLGDGKNGNVYKEIIPNAVVLPGIPSFNKFKIDSIFKSIIFPIKFSKIIEGKLESNKYDAIIFRRQYYAMLAFFLSKKFKTKAFWHIPGVIKSNSLKRFYSRFLSIFKIIPIANSEYTRTTLGSICEYVVYPGFDELRTSKDTDTPKFREIYGIPSDAIVYGVAARIYPGKAQDLVIEGFINSGAIEKGRFLLIAGAVVDQDYWKHILERFGSYFNNKIIYINEIQEIKEFYASIDILINGGVEAEAFGISVAEALGSSKPVMAFGLGGPVEMIADGTNGWIVENPTLDCYIDNFKRTLINRDQLMLMGKESKLKSTEFSVPVNVKKLISIINKNV